MTSRNHEENSTPSITVTIEVDMPVPPGTTEREAIKAARKEFAGVVEDENTRLDLQYNDE